MAALEFRFVFNLMHHMTRHVKLAGDNPETRDCRRPLVCFLACTTDAASANFLLVSHLMWSASPSFLHAYLLLVLLLVMLLLLLLPLSPLLRHCGCCLPPGPTAVLMLLLLCLLCLLLLLLLLQVVLVLAVEVVVVMLYPGCAKNSRQSHTVSFMWSFTPFAWPTPSPCAHAARTFVLADHLVRVANFLYRAFLQRATYSPKPVIW